MRAFIFPGQGSQAVGMGKALAEASPAARAVLEDVDAALGESLSRLMAEGPAEELTLTEHAQPAIMANAIATLRVVEQMAGVRLTDMADYVAGHSLGEYTALCAAGALDLATTARLLRTRGQAMQEAVPVGEGAMAVLLGADLELARTIAGAAIDATLAEGGGELVCTVANDNDPSQVVISGHRAAIARAVLLAKELGAKRALLLPVSAPFHCPLMQPAAEVMANALLDADLRAPVVPVLCSVCFHLSSEPVCEICRNSNRDNTTICVVADSRDLIALEKTREYKGKYHVLGGVISPIDGIGPEQLTIHALLRRVSQHTPQEVIMAISPSVEGETTTLYVGHLLKPFTKVTRIAFGLPVGGDLEYADEVTLARAMEGRRELD